MGYAQKSNIEATDLRCIQLVNNLFTLPGTAVPTSGTYGAGTIVRNTAPASGQPIDWACSISGTMGSLGTVTATTTAGSNAITVAGAKITNLSEGAMITIATATGGPWLVSKISGSTIHLNANVANSVTAQAVSYSAGTFVAGPNRP
jgi:hypothetical protein